MDIYDYMAGLRGEQTIDGVPVTTLLKNAGIDFAPDQNAIQNAIDQAISQYSAQNPTNTAPQTQIANTNPYGTPGFNPGALGMPVVPEQPIFSTPGINPNAPGGPDNFLGALGMPLQNIGAPQDMAAPMNVGGPTPGPLFDPAALTPYLQNMRK